MNLLTGMNESEKAAYNRMIEEGRRARRERDLRLYERSIELRRKRREEREAKDRRDEKISSALLMGWICVMGAVMLGCIAKVIAKAICG